MQNNETLKMITYITTSITVCVFLFAILTKLNNFESSLESQNQEIQKKIINMHELVLFEIESSEK